jgi:ATP-dependent DNA helicase RecQ
MELSNCLLWLRDPSGASGRFDPLARSPADPDTGENVGNAEPWEVWEMLQEALIKYWGYDRFRPLQEEAMRTVLDHRDSLIVLPTGGGKSLCYQAPALCLPGLAIVVSPLISLMKDQVDALLACGVSAAYINSSQTAPERRQVTDFIRRGTLKLLYIAPERLVQDRTLEFLAESKVSLFAIDEAHCISEWGHDFRPEYRELSLLKQRFPGVGVHAFTATATPRVRNDIAAQLRLTNPETLVGSFDRPNLIYRVERREKLIEQVRAVMDAHPGDSGIIYCLTRKDVDTLHATLTGLGYRTLPYHAGLSDDERHRHQDSFVQEKVDTIIATVAFGMGIDKSNVRYVIHAGMPKSLENYQQESGRAGRDGLEADCVLLYSGADFMAWKSRWANDETPPGAGAVESLQAMSSYCTNAVCRHRALVRYFGQELNKESCGACDLCLGQVDLVDDALVIGQKILSSVIRQNQRFGAEYTALVLRGSNDQRILQNGHEKLSTHGLLAQESQRAVRDWIEQLAGQGFLDKVGEYQVLEVTPLGRRLLKGEVTPRLLKPVEREEQETRRRTSARGSSSGTKSGSSVADESWEGVDRTLFESLRQLRRQVADELGVPAYIVFSDASLRDMASKRPKNLVEFRKVRGVGDKKTEDFGEKFIAAIVAAS